MSALHNEIQIMNKSKIILIADETLESKLSKQLSPSFQTYCANSENEALLVLSQNTSDVVLVEHKLCSDIIRAELNAQNCKTILLSPTPSFEEGIQVLQQGFRGYGNLYSHTDRLIAAINLVKAGDVWLGASIVETLKASSTDINQDQSAATFESTQKISKLTKKERSVAELTVKGISNKDIADQLLMSERTVKAHLSSIYQKLSIKNRTELILNYKNDL